MSVRGSPRGWAVPRSPRRREEAAEPAQRAADGIEIRECDHLGVRVIGVSGALDLGAAAEFCARVDAARAAGSGRVLLDLTQLHFCDSSGLRALIGAAAEVVASAGRVALVPPNEGPAARLFALTGADEVFPLHPTVTQAQVALAGSG